LQDLSGYWLLASSPASKVRIAINWMSAEYVMGKRKTEVAFVHKEVLFRYCVIARGRNYVLKSSKQVSRRTTRESKNVPREYKCGISTYGCNPLKGPNRVNNFNIVHVANIILQQRLHISVSSEAI